MGPGSAPALAGPTLRPPSGARHAMEPPPVPTVTRSIIGTLTGKRPTSPSVVTPGSPPSTRQTSVLVPPASMVSTRSKPAARARYAAPSAPAAGPLRMVVIGWLITSRAEITPPLDFITWKGTPAPSSAVRRPWIRPT